MKAFELRRKVILTQKVEAEARILFYTDEGLNWCYALEEGALDDEVAKYLTEEGYDVKTIQRPCPTNCFSIVFWDKAEDGRKGTFEIIEDSEFKYLQPDDEYRAGPKTLAELSELTMVFEFEDEDGFGDYEEDDEE